MWRARVDTMEPADLKDVAGRARNTCHAQFCLTRAVLFDCAGARRQTRNLWTNKTRQSNQGMPVFLCVETFCLSTVSSLTLEAHMFWLI